MTTDEHKTQLCPGCVNDSYNSPTSECFLLRRATEVLRTKVGDNESPPHPWNPQWTLHCHKPKDGTWLSKEELAFTNLGRHSVGDGQ